MTNDKAELLIEVMESAQNRMAYYLAVGFASGFISGFLAIWMTWR